MPVEYGESERLLGKVFSLARDNNLEAIVQEINPLPFKEKASSSDNENSPATKGGEFQKRICDKGTMKEKRGKPVVASDRPGKGDKLHKHNIHHSDGAKYMSYLKISKKQHQLVKSLKQSQ
uniref:Uncharacterized protein n=1 Tax=Populus trichocarpa TaxID=3694 RepID=A0A2K1R7X3_POPTR